MAEQIHCCIDGDKDWAPWTVPADRNIDKSTRERQRKKIQADLGEVVCVDFILAAQNVFTFCLCIIYVLSTSISANSCMCN